MEQKDLEYVVEKTKALIEAQTCCKEARDRANAWLASIGSDMQKEEAKKFIEELEEDVVTIENLIAFSGSEEGKQYFGEEVASGIHAHALAIQKQGAKYCDCPACAAVVAILEKKDIILA